MVWTINIGEDLFCNDGLSIRSRRRLIDSILERLQGPVGPELIAWIWDEYAAMARGTSSEGFVRGHRCIALAPLLLDSLSIKPLGIAPDAWDHAVQETETAIDVVMAHHFDSGSASTAEEQDRFLSSVAALLGRPVGAGKLLAVWDELAKSGPTGKKYVEPRLASIRRDTISRGPDR